MATLEELLGVRPDTVSSKGSSPDHGEDDATREIVEIIAPDYQKRCEKKKPKRTKDKRLCRDPRFGGISGDFDMEKYKNSYDFVEKLEVQEVTRMEKRLKHTKNIEKRNELKEEMNRRRQRIRDKEEKQTEMDIRRQLRRKEREAVLRGKMPYIPKERQVKDVLMTYKASKMTKGQLQKAVKNRSKRIAKRGMPMANSAEGVAGKR